MTLSLVKLGSLRYVLRSVRNRFSGILLTSKSMSFSRNFMSPSRFFLASSQVSLNPNSSATLQSTVLTSAGGLT